MTTKTILLAGVGGQGTILAADLLARAATAAGYIVKVSEIHGMSQRGGSVTTVVRFGDEVNSMMADIGECDCLLSFETTEALRNLSFLKVGGYLLVSDETIKSLPVLTGTAQMPARAREELKAAGAILLPAVELAEEAGNAKASNVALLGALSKSLDIPEDTWIECISARVPPKTIDANIAAFKAGRAFSED